jgi:hypothetical protein
MVLRLYFESLLGIKPVVLSPRLTVNRLISSFLVELFQVNIITSIGFEALDNCGLQIAFIV